MKLTEKQELHFWSKIDIPKLPTGFPDWDNVDHNTCWKWIGRPNGSGVGRINIAGKAWINTHVMMYCIRGHESSDGHQINRITECRDRMCMNWNHLYIGTPSESRLKLHEAGLCKKGGASGENNGNVKIPDDEIREIIHKFVSGERNITQLTREYETHKIMIRMYLMGEEGRTKGWPETIESRAIIENRKHLVSLNDGLFEMGLRWCSKCQKIKKTDEFGESKRNRNNLKTECYRCLADKISAYRMKDTIAGESMRTRGTINRTFQRMGYSKNDPSEQILQCDFPTVINRMTLNGKIPMKGNHRDHIVPVSIAKSYDEIIILNHWTNWQLTSPQVNLAKHNMLPSIHELPDDLSFKVLNLYFREVEERGIDPYERTFLSYLNGYHSI